jgi:hypothetical protein
MPRWAREPLLHFTVAGALLCAGYRLLGPRPRDRIVVSGAFVAGLREEARTRTGRLPTEAEEEELLQRFLDEEMLHREALALGLDRGDVIVRRRPVQKMELLARRTPAEPGPAELQRYLERHRDRYDLPPRVSLRHVFAGDGDVAPLERALLGGADWEKLGLPFLGGRRFSRKSQKELASLFGPEAARAAMSLPDGVWSPLRSRYGLHLVQIEERLPADRVADERVRNDWLEEQRNRPDPEALASVRAHYRVERP